MEKVKIIKRSIKYGLNKNEEFLVKRNGLGDCVLIVPDQYKPNIIMLESELRQYGILTGDPKVYFS